MSVYGVIIDYNAFDVVFYILFIYFCNVCVCVCVCACVCVCVHWIFVIKIYTFKECVSA